MKSVECCIYYRDIVNVLCFLLRHGPFQDALTYVPERHFTADGARVYGEMHTGDWWWLQQEELPEGATVVPLLLATDKTMLTDHHCNLSIWLVYLTIGNLNLQACRSQTQPSIVLLDLIPVAKLGKEHHCNLKSTIYHRAMEKILQRELFLIDRHVIPHFELV